MTAAIGFEGVVKRYGAHEALAGVDLDLAAGEALGLIGVNGAGKTTLIKTLLDFCALDAGAIRIFGTPHTRTQARERLAFLPERFVPPYFLTGHEFLQMMGRLYARAPATGDLDAIAAALDLEPAALAKPVRTLSKGMAQKLGLAACLLSGRELLVLDEPMSGLDPRARARVKEQLLQVRRAGRTLFFSTHLLADVEALCDRVAVLHEGRVRFLGTGEAFRAAYAADTLEDAYLACVGA